MRGKTTRYIAKQATANMAYKRQRDQAQNCRESMPGIRRVVWHGV